MNQDTLNSLKPGEKVADIQEYFWGKNGRILAYDVIVYECTKKFLRKKINKVEFPFYFVSKKFAEKFLEHYDSFNFNIDSDREIYMCPKNIQKLHNNYWLINAYTSMSCPINNSERLKAGEIWGGYINTDSNSKYPFKNENFSYELITNIEEIASKEGTTGKTYSFKLTEI